MSRTSIEWTEHSINPIRARLNGRVGHYCEKLSPGCKHCYSSRFQPRFGLPQFQEQRRTDVAPFLDTVKLAEVLRRRKPTTYFWCDMTDMFGEWVPDEWIASCFGVMAATPQHTHQVLTKRAKRMREWFEWIGSRHTGTLFGSAGAFGVDVGPLNGITWPLPNTWLGVSAEDQQRADERIPYLLETPAAVRFVSAEPLLGPIDFTRLGVSRMPGDPPGPGELLSVDALEGTVSTLQMARTVHTAPVACIDWLIAGAESGPGARPMQDDWVRSLRDQCANAGVAFFLKQKLNERGHKVSLPLLDGVRHDAMPEVRHA